MWYGTHIYGSVESSKIVGPFKTYEKLIERFYDYADSDSWDNEDDFLLAVNPKTKETQIKYFN